MWRYACLLLAACAILLGAGNPGSSLPVSDFQVHDPVRHQNLTIFPISARAGADMSGYLTLDEGLAQGVVRVGELGTLRAAGAMVRPVRPGGSRLPRTQTFAADSAQVNELAIQNLSDRPLLLLAGEVVSGGKQDRVVGKDRIVPPHSEPIPLAVFCVEPGRWHGLSTDFAASKAMAHPALRKEAVEAKDQQRVWNEVAKARSDVAQAVVAGGVAGSPRGGVSVAAAPPPARAAEIMGSGSSYARTMDAQPVQDALKHRTQAFLPSLPKGTIGLVVAVNGRPVWADMFPSAALFDRYRAKLLQSYVIEAMRSGSPASKSADVAEARDFLRPLAGRESTETDPGVYRLVRTEASGLVTYELQSLDGKPITVHLARMAIQ